MKDLNNYITEKFKISKDISTEDDKYKITKDFRELFKIISRKFGKNHEVLDSLLNMADFDENEDIYYKFDPKSWAVFLRDVVNYDWISLKSNGKIDINNSNHKDIAKIMSEYNDEEIGKRIYKSF